MHRDYDVTQRASNIFLVNGRSFPFTLRDSPILVKPDQRTRLRVLNVGPRTVYLHTHGHHPTLTDLDGYPVPKTLVSRATCSTSARNAWISRCAPAAMGSIRPVPVSG